MDRASSFDATNLPENLNQTSNNDADTQVSTIVSIQENLLLVTYTPIINYVSLSIAKILLQPEIYWKCWQTDRMKDG